MKEPRPRFGILGFGRFGQMVAEYLEPWGATLVHDPAAPVPASMRADSLEEIARARAIILAVPIRALPDTLRALAPHLQAGALVADVASVKVRPMEWMSDILPPRVEFVGTHPLFGPDSAPRDLAGQSIVLVPGRISSSRLERLRRFLERLGLRIVEASAEAHDRSMARTQGLSHWIGRALGDMGAGPEPLDTVSYRLLLDVAHRARRDSRELFQDIHRYNPFCALVRGELRARLDALEEELHDREGAP